MGIKDIQDMFNKKNDKTMYQLLNKMTPMVDKKLK